MHPELIVYFKDVDADNSFTSKLIKNKQELQEIVCQDSNWPILVLISFDPPLPSEVFKSLNQYPLGVYCTRSFCESGFDKSWEIDKDVEVFIADTSSYPLTNIAGKALNIDYSSLKNNTPISVENETTQNKPEKEQEYDDYNLNDYSWSKRTREILMNNEINYLSDLVKFSKEELLEFKYFGESSLSEVKFFLGQLGLSLRVKKQITKKHLNERLEKIIRKSGEKGITTTELTRKTRFIGNAKNRQIILKELENDNLIYLIKETKRIKDPKRKYHSGKVIRESRWFSTDKSFRPKNAFNEENNSDRVKNIIMQSGEKGISTAELIQITRFIRVAKYRNIILKDLEKNNLIYCTKKNVGVGKPETRWFASEKEKIFDGELELDSTEIKIDPNSNHYENSSLKSHDTVSSEIIKVSPKTINVDDDLGLKGKNILNWFEINLSKLEEIERDLIKKRFGLFSNPMTIEKLSIEYKIPNWEINSKIKSSLANILKQIEIIDRKVHSSKSDLDSFRKMLSEILQKLNEPPTLQFLSTTQHFLKGIEENHNVFNLIFEKFMDNEFFIVKLNGIFYLGRIKQTDLDYFKNKVKKYVAENKGKSFTKIMEGLELSFPEKERPFARLIIGEFLDNSVSKIKTKDEVNKKEFAKNYSGIKLWEKYSRKELASWLEVEPVILTTGVVSTGNFLFLFVTLEKEDLPEEFQYKDKFLSPLIFQWQSQNRTRQESKTGQSFCYPDRHGKTIHLFIRRKKKDGNTIVPFFYCGVPRFISWEGEKPITIKWELEEAVPENLRLDLKVPDETENSSPVVNDIIVTYGVLFFNDYFLRDEDIENLIPEWSPEKDEDSIPDRYQGEIKNGLPNGKGIIIYHSPYSENNSIYEGRFNDGLRHGQGKITFLDDMSTFEGEWEDDYPNGFGILTDPNGTAYKGVWKYGKLFGDDGYLNYDGNKYKGEIKDGLRHGEGTLIIRTSIFEGLSLEGRNAKGKLTVFGGRHKGYIYEGIFEKGVIKYGKVTRPDGSKYEGNIRGRRPNGEGTCIWPDETKYEGYWLHGLQHRQGKIFHKDGYLLYEGGFQKGYPYGEGKKFSKNGELIFEGELKDWGINDSCKQVEEYKYRSLGKDKNGHEVLVSIGSNGPILKYLGYNYSFPENINMSEITIEEALDYIVSNPQQNDFVKAKFVDGSTYSGRWRNGEIHGNGEYIYTNGDIFVGEWKQGKKHRGEYKYQAGHRYKGDWEKDKPHGIGTLYFGERNGDNYAGEWKNGGYHGFGIFEFKNGDEYFGRWKNGKIHGQGIFTWSNGNMYHGEYKYGKKHGQGTFIFPNGVQYEGEWKDGYKHGNGTYTSIKGEIFKAKWINGHTDSQDIDNSGFLQSAENKIDKKEQEKTKLMEAKFIKYLETSDEPNFPELSDIKGEEYHEKKDGDNNGESSVKGFLKSAEEMVENKVKKTIKKMQGTRFM